MKTWYSMGLCSLLVLYFLFSTAYSVNVNMKEDTLTVDEGSTVTLTVKRDDSAGALTVKVKVNDVSTTAGTDFDNDGTIFDVEFADADNEKVTTIAITDDDREEISETFDVEIQTDDAYTIVSPEKTTVTITDNDKSTVSMKESTLTVDESDGTVSVVFVRTPPAGGTDTTIKVILDVVAGSATESDDYTKPSLEVTFTASDTEKTVDITIADDSREEIAETFDVELKSDIAYDIDSGSTTKTTVTIRDNDKSTVNMKVSALSVVESEGTVSVVFVRTPPDDGTDTTIKVILDVVARSATESDDYTKPSLEVTFTASDTEKTVDITIADDSREENAETFDVDLKSDDAYVSGSTTKTTVSITDNDKSTVNMKVSALSVVESEGTVSVVFVRTPPDGGTDTIIKVILDVVAGSATESDDYTKPSLEVTFTASDTEKTVDITIEDDTTEEDSETFEVIIQADSAYTTGSTAKTTVTITDDDKLSIGVKAAALSVGESDGSASIVIVRYGGADDDITAIISVVAGTATEGVDYQKPSTLEVTFTASTESSVEETFTVSITDDSVFEPDETFTVSVVDDTGYEKHTQSSTTVTITNDDQPPVEMKESNVSVNETDGSVRVTVQRAASSTVTLSAITVKLVVNDGTATLADNDFVYAGTPISVSLAEDATEGTTDIDIVDDELEETAETFEVAIASDAAYEIGSTSKTTVTIIDDDTKSDAVQPCSAMLCLCAAALTYYLSYY